MDTAGRYNPSTNSWQVVSPVGAPAGRWAHTAIWTGTEMIVWGGELDAALNDTNTGGRYDPATDTWTLTSLNLGVPSERRNHTAVWTGSEMIVWGGDRFPFPLFLDTGARYNPATSTGRPAGGTTRLPTPGQPPPPQRFRWHVGATRPCGRAPR